MAFKKISKLLPQRLRQAGVEQGVEAARVLDVANEVLETLFGKDVANTTVRAVAVKHGKLQVASVHSAFRQEVNKKGNEIRARVNEQLGREIVRAVQVII
jgi:hypothetical protein